MSDALMVSSSFLPGRGGIESFLAELCDSLAPRVAVLAAATRDDQPLPSDLPYATHPFPGRLLRPSRAAIEATVAAARAENTTKILFGTPWPLVLMGPKLRKQGLRYAVIVHGAELLVPSAVPLLRRKLARALSEADLILPVSNYTANEVRATIEGAGFKVPRVELLRAKVDLERFRPDVVTPPVKAELGIDSQDKVILCFGRLVKRKGVDRMIEALPQIAERIGEVTLVVAGTGPEEERLRTLARRLAIPMRARTDDGWTETPEGEWAEEGRGPGVVFAGPVTEEDAPAVYAAADLFALPVVDRWFGLEIEGLGVVLLEASACEVPCITGRSGGTPEAVIHDRTGYVIDARNRTELVDKATFLLLNPQVAKTFGRAGRRHVAEGFSAPESSVPPALTTWLSG